MRGGLHNILAGRGDRGMSDDVLGSFRVDSMIDRALVGRPHDEEAVHGYREGANAAYFGRLMRESGRFSIQLDEEDRAALGIRTDSAARFDSFSPSAGLFMARQLEHIFARVLETPYPDINGPTHFPINTEVAPGARTYTIRRFDETGEAIIWRNGVDIPRVGMIQDEESRPVRHIATSFAYDIFDQMSAQFANVGLVGGLLKSARKACAQKWNRLIWFGDRFADVYGVLTFPYLQVRAVATKFDGTADPDDVIAALSAGASWPAENSKGVFRPNTMLTSEKVRNYLMNTPRSANSDMSIGKWWLENNTQGIKEIKTAWEMEGADGTFPDDCHGILFYKAGDEDAVRLVVPQGFTTLPVQRIGVDDVTICYQSYGGAAMPDAGHNVLLYVEVSDS